MDSIKKNISAAKSLRIPIPKEHIQTKLYSFVKSKYQKLLRTGFAIYDENIDKVIIKNHTFKARLFIIKNIKPNNERKILVLVEDGYDISISVTKYFLVEGKGIIGIKDEYKDTFNNILETDSSLKGYINADNFVSKYGDIKAGERTNRITFTKYKKKMKNIIVQFLSDKIEMLPTETKNIGLDVKVLVKQLGETELYSKSGLKTGEELRDYVLNLPQKKLLKLISNKSSHFYNFVVDCFT